MPRRPSVKRDKRFFKRHPFFRDLLIGAGIGLIVVGLAVATVFTLGATMPALGISLGSVMAFTGSIGLCAAIGASFVAATTLIAGFFGSIIRFFKKQPSADVKPSADQPIKPDIKFTPIPLSLKKPVLFNLPTAENKISLFDGNKLRPNQKDTPIPTSTNLLLPSHITRQGFIGDIQSLNNELFLCKMHFNVFQQAPFLNKLPDPVPQKGFHCGYYAAAYATKCWHEQDNNYQEYPARLFGTEKNNGFSLKMFGKQAGLTGVGGIFDVKQFSTILTNTPYHGQVANFYSPQELQHFITTALKHNLPIIFPVDWVNKGIGFAGGNHPHYITIVGCVDYGKDQLIYFLSSNHFYKVPLSHLFKSNDNLKTFAAQNFIKIENNDEGWMREAQASPALYKIKKVHKQPDTDLAGLRNKMVLIYPKSLKHQYEPLFNTVDENKAPDITNIKLRTAREGVPLCNTTNSGRLVYV